MTTKFDWTHLTRAIAPALLLVAALATAPPAARAQGPAPEAPLADLGAEGDVFEMAPMHDGHGGGGRGRMGMRMRGYGPALAEKLNLTEQQKDQMAELRDAQQRKMIGIRSSLDEAKLDLRKLMRADDPSKSQIDATIDRMAKLRADAAKSRVATRLAMRELLTPEQKKTMDDMRGTMQMRRGARSGGKGRA